ncbi:ribonuclease H1-like [Anopheles marshallii]|uniref:ribonuclease H1-like n=1 Tax=Anopheles marshallii TaxID=1521116 RepID=UPI00237B2F46|nr:ribonuclease H1-like [Anopheles marshallii]
MLLRTIASRAMPFYAVAKGRQVGIFATWPECQAQVNGFTGARFKKFTTKAEAQQFITTHAGSGDNTGSVLTANKQPSTNWKGKRSASSSSTFASCSKQAKKTILLEEVPVPVRKKVQYGEHNFLQDNDGFVHVYTDGSCEGNGTAQAAAGVGVYFDEGHALNTSKPVSGRATNNCGEIQAASLAIRIAREQGIQQLQINTDSKFLIDSITKWISGWKQRNWTLASGGPVKNKTDFMELDRELRTGGMKIKWNHVDAHCGILGNERADQLARKGSEMYRNQRR